MNAETLKAAELNLPQAFLLLATNDIDGKPAVPMYVLRTAVAGAILAELDLIGAIGLQGKHVKATGATPKTDLEHELELIRHKSRPHTPKHWVSILEGRAEVQRVYEGMASLGIVERVGEKHLGVFRSVRYPEKDHAPEAALLQQIQAELNGETTVLTEAAAPGQDSAVPNPAVPNAAATPEPGTSGGVADATTRAPASTPGPTASRARTIALIALLHAAGLLGRLFPDADRIWADELAKDYWPARAVEEELRMIRLAEQEAPAL